MLTDFKFSVVKDSNGLHILARLYEGDITTVNETDRDGQTSPVTRYRRTGIVEEKTFLLPVEQDIDDAQQMLMTTIAAIPNTDPISQQS